MHPRSLVLLRLLLMSRQACATCQAQMYQTHHSPHPTDSSDMYGAVTLTAISKAAIIPVSIEMQVGEGCHLETYVLASL